MRVQHKNFEIMFSNTEYEVIEESKNYYIVKPLDSFGKPYSNFSMLVVVALSKNDYIPVKEEKWIDCTNECMMNNVGEIHCPNGHILVAGVSYRYRLTFDYYYGSKHVIIMEKKSY